MLCGPREALFLGWFVSFFKNVTEWVSGNAVLIQMPNQVALVDIFKVIIFLGDVKKSSMELYNPSTHCPPRPHRRYKAYNTAYYTVLYRIIRLLGAHRIIP